MKVYVDQRKKLAADWNATLGDEDYVDQEEIESSWPEGYGQMTTVDAATVGADGVKK